MRKHEFPFARVLVFVPFADRDGRLHNPYYDYPGFREDVSGWFEPLSLPHQWVAVTASGLPEAIEAAADAHAAGGAVIVNLCDGSPGEEYPGLEVVEALEAAALPYTGADPAFYRVTSSKLAMKARFRAAGLPTAPWQVIHEAERDLWSAGQTLGYPLILKLDGGWGALSAASIVHDHEAALNLFAALGHELRRSMGRFSPSRFFRDKSSQPSFDTTRQLASWRCQAANGPTVPIRGHRCCLGIGNRPARDRLKQRSTRSCSALPFPLLRPSAALGTRASTCGRIEMARSCFWRSMRIAAFQTRPTKPRGDRPSDAFCSFVTPAWRNRCARS